AQIYSLSRRLSLASRDNREIKDRSAPWRRLPVVLGVWSRHLLDRVEDEATWLFCPGVADVLIGREPFEDLETASEVVGRDEVDQARSEFARDRRSDSDWIDSRFVVGALHPLDLPIRPGVVGLSQTMLDVVG